MKTDASKARWGRREQDEREEGRKGLHFIFMFFKRSLNKGAPRHPNGDVLGSLKCPKGLYYSVAFSEEDS